jgi:hypothetical protein
LTILTLPKSPDELALLPYAFGNIFLTFQSQSRILSIGFCEFASIALEMNFVGIRGGILFHISFVHR